MESFQIPLKFQIKWTIKKKKKIKKNIFAWYCTDKLLTQLFFILPMVTATAPVKACAAGDFTMRMSVKKYLKNLKNKYIVFT